MPRCKADMRDQRPSLEEALESLTAVDDSKVTNRGNSDGGTVGDCTDASGEGGECTVPLCDGEEMLRCADDSSVLSVGVKSASPDSLMDSTMLDGWGELSSIKLCVEENSILQSCERSPDRDGSHRALVSADCALPKLDYFVEVLSDTNGDVCSEKLDECRKCEVSNNELSVDSEEVPTEEINEGGLVMEANRCSMHDEDTAGDYCTSCELKVCEEMFDSMLSDSTQPGSSECENALNNSSENIEEKVQSDDLSAEMKSTISSGEEKYARQNANKDSTSYNANLADDSHNSTSEGINLIEPDELITGFDIEDDTVLLNEVKHALEQFMSNERPKKVKQQTRNDSDTNSNDANQEIDVTDISQRNKDACNLFENPTHTVGSVEGGKIQSLTENAKTGSEQKIANESIVSVSGDCTIVEKEEESANMNVIHTFQCIELETQNISLSTGDQQELFFTKLCNEAPVEPGHNCRVNETVTNASVPEVVVLGTFSKECENEHYFKDSSENRVTVTCQPSLTAKNATAVNFVKNTTLGEMKILPNVQISKSLNSPSDEGSTIGSDLHRSYDNSDSILQDHADSSCTSDSYLSSLSHSALTDYGQSLRNRDDCTNYPYGFERTTEDSSAIMDIQDVESFREALFGRCSEGNAHRQIVHVNKLPTSVKENTYGGNRTSNQEIKEELYQSSPEGSRVFCSHETPTEDNLLNDKSKKPSFSLKNKFSPLKVVPGKHSKKYRLGKSENKYLNEYNSQSLSEGVHKYTIDEKVDSTCKGERQQNSSASKKKD